MSVATFETLRENSLLPTHIKSPSDLADVQIVILTGTHGDEPSPIRAVSPYFDDPYWLPQWMLPIQVNKEAVLQTQRFIGNGNGQGQQAMAHFNTLKQLDADSEYVEERVAAGLMWLASALPSNHLFIDIHSNLVGNEYAESGDITSSASPAVARLFFDKEQVPMLNFRVSSLWSTMREYLGRYVLIETSEPVPGEEETYDEHIRDCIDSIASKGLRYWQESYPINRLGNPEFHGLRFFETVREVLIGDPMNLEIDKSVIPYLEELEGLKPSPSNRKQYAKFSDELIQYLGLKPGDKYMLNYWGYSGGPFIDIESQKRAGLRTVNEQRRLAIGTIDRIIQPPLYAKDDELMWFELIGSNQILLET